MNEKGINALEFRKVTSLLAGYAASRVARARAAELLPLCDVDDIADSQRETTAAASFILRHGGLPLGGISDITGAVSRAALGGVLSVGELSAVSDFIYVSQKVVNYSRADKRDFDGVLDPIFDMLRPDNALGAEINRCITDSGEVADSASAKLYEIRRNTRQAADKIKDSLNSIIRSKDYKNMLQDAVVTMRGGRYCVPVRSEYRSSFPGLTHDQSGTGATVFIEPQSVVTLNNRIRELSAAERVEIEKILARLSDNVASSAERLQADYESLTRLDFIFAKGAYSLSINGTEPLINRQGIIELIKARHPLLPKEACVPIDIYIGEGFTTLLITGPNTGGKTVCLKTLGLLTLMAAAGLHIPARENSRVAVFDDVYADIGDEQSIEQSLSTFSGHMRNIVNILGDVTDNSLVLLDELGAGTDPVEGAALATSIVDELLSRRIRTAVTTHYSELKTYALSTDGAINAACEFDVTTLKPTYRLLIGVPGKSNAFAISQRLGLSDGVIERAKALVSTNDARFEDIVTDLEAAKKTAEIEQDRAAGYRREAERAKAEADKLNDKLKTSREKILDEARAEARKLVLAAERESNDIIKEMHAIKNGLNFKQAEEKRGALKAAASQLAPISHNDNERKGAELVFSPLRPEAVKPGTRVFSNSLNQSGVIAAVAGDGAFAQVQVGALKLKLATSDLYLDETPVEATKPRVAASGISPVTSISPRLDLRGMNTEEALESVERHLDAAYLSRLGAVEIIHGKGTGTLRAAVQAYLKKSPHVKSYRLGELGEGDNGVTIATLG